MSGAPVRYRIEPADPAAHLFTVVCRVEEPDPAGQLVSLPAWIPGSYVVRDFARHVVQLAAAAGGEAIAISRADKSSWRCAPCSGPLELRYEVYAYDLSVRGAYLDLTRGYFNGPCVFLRVHGHEDRACVVDVRPPSDDRCGGWRVATSMARDGADVHGFGPYRAADYAELIDHPVELGHFDVVPFEVRGVPHELVVSGRHRGDLARVVQDLVPICEQHMSLFAMPPPIDRYVFLLLLVGNGYGGLEHRWSSSLVARRDDLPQPGEKGVSRSYCTFLGLASHEYFHLWNVKRIRPAAVARSELREEAHTELLWVFEGITSYYDDLALVRSGRIDAERYLGLVGDTATRVWQSPGRFRQSLADSSFDAWTKLYRQNENSPNAMISYYTKGALAALALDLTIRRESGGERSLDDVMRAVWARHGQPDEPVEEEDFERLVAGVTGLDLAAFFDLAVRGTEDLPLAELLAHFGVRFECLALRDGETRLAADAPANPPALNVRLAESGGRLSFTSVLSAGPAEAAGIAAGDELVAIDGLRVASLADYHRVLGRVAPGERVRVAAFRRDELLELEAVVGEAPRQACRLTLDPAADEAACRRREAWLAPG